MNSNHTSMLLAHQLRSMIIVHAHLLFAFALICTGCSRKGNSTKSASKEESTQSKVAEAVPSGDIGQQEPTVLVEWGESHHSIREGAANTLVATIGKETRKSEHIRKNRLRERMDEIANLPDFSAWRGKIPNEAFIGAAVPIESRFVRALNRLQQPVSGVRIVITFYDESQIEGTTHVDGKANFPDCDTGQVERVECKYRDQTSSEKTYNSVNTVFWEPLDRNALKWPITFKMAL